MNSIQQSNKPTHSTGSGSKDWRQPHQSAAPLQTPLPAEAIVKEDPSSKLSSAEPSQRSAVTANVPSQSTYCNAQNQQISTATNTIHSSSQQQLIQEDQARMLYSNNNMLAHSQPSTPHPESAVQQQPTDQQQQPAATGGESTPFRQPTPSYSTGRSTSLRGRSNLFSNDVGPYFSSTKSYDNLYASDKQTLLSVRIQAKFDRGFFLADNDWTCYRRNYFQVSSVFSIHGFNHYYAVEPHLYVSAINSNNETVLYPVQRFLLGISARAANNDKSVDLIQHTPKRDKGPQFTPEPKPIMPGGNLTMSSVANNQNIVTFERIQFKTATANNGKRRAAQQYYVVIAELYAETDRMELIKVGTCQSASLIVRGRSPGHYADNNTLAVTTARHSQHPYMYQQQPYPEPSVSAPLPGSTGAPLMVGPPPPPSHHHQHHHHQQAQPQPTPTTSSEPPMTPQLTPPLRQDIRPNSSMYYSPTSTTAPMKSEMMETPQHHQSHYDSNPVAVAAAAAAPTPQPSSYSYYPYYPQPAPYTQYIVHDGHDYYNNSHHHLPHPQASHHPSQNDAKYQATPLMYQQHAAYEFNRARYDSASSGSSSVPSPGGSQQQHTHHQQQPTPTASSTGTVTEQQTYFGQQHHSRSSPYSSPYPVMQQQQQQQQQQPSSEQQQQQQQQTRMPPLMTKQPSMA